MNQSPVRQFLKDYKAPSFQIFKTHLDFEINDESTLVQNEMEFHRKGEGALTLNGPLKGLISLVLKTIDGKERPLLDGTDFKVQDGLLTLAESLTSSLNQFSLIIKNELIPKENTALEGLYQSGSGLCTQCEAEGFRSITFFLDRPDVMARYTTTITASRVKYPILLSNGNRVSSEELPNGRHRVRWEDPFPKPSYLFALVAGDYDVLTDTFVTKSGRRVSLEIYSQKGQSKKCQHAMDALKRSMKWDEETYGREYDLDQYLILAVDDFNGGAMENKGLNIFNSQLVFADTKTATDLNFERVESVIAHEYFHNWTGNRITLRDWFQLSLKEGLTVFREQNYMMDLTNHSLKRIDDVQLLRNRQFPEDAGPNAHPVRPESCYAVDNFYTTTVYEKGAEVIRVLKTLLGDDLFSKGLNHYFNTFDGQAITIEDFLSSFESVSDKNLKPFKKWYSQAGTPLVHVTESYDSERKQYTLTLSQSCPPTPGFPEKEPFVIPIKTAFFSRDTKKQLALEDGQVEVVLELDTPTKTWTFPMPSKPVASLLRGFSAPVILNWKRPLEDLEFLSLHDNDGFNRWDALQQINLKELTQIYTQLSQGQTASVNKYYVSLFENLLENSLTAPELTARLIELPSPDYVLQNISKGFDPDALSDCFSVLETHLAETFNDRLWALDTKLEAIIDVDNYSFQSMSYRSLQAQLWKWLGRIDKNLPALFKKFEKASSMNQQSGILNALNQKNSSQRREALALFENQWQNDPVTMNKWLNWHAQFDHEDVYLQLEKIMEGPHFKASNPNNARGLLGRFPITSWKGFHRKDGKGYDFFKRKFLMIDALNPQTAARIALGLGNWYLLEPQRKSLLLRIMKEMMIHPKLSKNSFEILKRSIEFEGTDSQS